MKDRNDLKYFSTDTLSLPFDHISLFLVSFFCYTKKHSVSKVYQELAHASYVCVYGLCLGKHVNAGETVSLPSPFRL